jgi:hypothetical protein
VKEKKERRKKMTQDNRVLGRKGARELTMREVEQVAGGFITLICTEMNTTAHAPGDGDGCSRDHDLA